MILQTLENLKTRYNHEEDNYSIPVKGERERALRSVLYLATATNNWTLLLDLLLDGKSTNNLLVKKKESALDKLKNALYLCYIAIKTEFNSYAIQRHRDMPEYQSIPVFGPIEKKQKSWDKIYVPFSESKDLMGRGTHFFDKNEISNNPIIFLLYVFYKFLLEEVLDTDELDAAVKYHIVHVVYLASITQRLNREQLQEVVMAHTDFDDFNLEAMHNIFIVQQSLGFSKEDLKELLLKLREKETVLSKNYKKINKLINIVTKILD